MIDLAVWQCLLEFGNARVGDPGLAEIELLQLHPFLRVTPTTHQPKHSNIAATHRYATQSTGFEIACGVVSGWAGARQPDDS